MFAKVPVLLVSRMKKVKDIVHTHNILLFKLNEKDWETDRIIRCQNHLFAWVKISENCQSSCKIVLVFNFGGPTHV